MGQSMVLSLWNPVPSYYNTPDYPFVLLTTELFTIHYPRSTTHDPLLTIHYSLFTIHHHNINLIFKT